MSTFNYLMDDMKSSLKAVMGNKKIFLPILIYNVILIIGVILIAALVIISFIKPVSDMIEGNPSFFSFLPLIITLLILGIIVNIFIVLFDTGLNYLIIGLLDGKQPSFNYFMEGIRKYGLTIIGTKIGIFFIALLSTIIWLSAYILYLVTVGVLTGGYGVIFLTAAINAFFGLWIFIVMLEDSAGFEALFKGFRFTKSHFWLMFLIAYIEYALSVYLPGLLGIFGAAITVIFIGYSVKIVFRMIMIKTYMRHREQV